MSAEEKFDAIVIGAGPAGLACAYALAREGKEVVVLERGSSAGEKNLTGGRMYAHALERLEPGLCAEAAAAGALERRVTREQIMCLSDNGGMTVDFAETTPDKEAQSWTVLHSRFNAWFASKVEEAGAVMACGVRVDSLLKKNGKVVGVHAGDDTLLADVVIAADGVNSLMAADAGLTPSLDAHAVGVGIKEVIELPESVIEDRFQIGSEGGAARVVLGCTGGIPGGGAIYTNRNSVSLVCVFNPAHAAEQDKRLPDLFQSFKMHPAVRPLLEGGTTVEYGGHLVMENGWRNVMQKPWCDGLLVAGEAAGYVINTGLIIRGIDLAILSGTAAAKAVLSGSTGEALGQEYQRQLEACRLNDAMRAAQKWPDFMASPRLFSAYPDMGVDMMRQLFLVDDGAQPLKKRLLGCVKNSRAGIMNMLGDAWRAYKAL